MITSVFGCAILLTSGHAVADYPLQGDFLARAKNRVAPIPGVPWFQALMAHAAIQGAVVGIVTGFWWLAVAEFLVHAFIDDGKCRGAFTFNQDQALHYVFKALWLFIAWSLTS